MATRRITRAELEAFLPDLFTSLSEKETERILSNLRIRAYNAGETIYCEGYQPHCLHCLLEGKVKVSRRGVGDRDQILRLLSSVDYFGISAALAGEPYSTDAMALEDCTIAQIPLDDFLPLLKQNAVLADIVTQRISKTLQLCYRRTLELTQKHIRGRLAEGILYMKDVFGEDEDQFIDVRMSREDLAYLCNMTRSNSIRTLSHFCQENIVQVVGRAVRIIDEKALQRISDQG